MSESTAVATQDQKALAVAEKRERQVQELVALTRGTEEEAKRIIQLAAVACDRLPALKQADKGSLWLAVREVASLRLPFGGRGAYLVPYKGQVQVIVSPHGLIELLYRNSLVRVVQARVVREGEPFRVRYAPEMLVEHEPLVRGTPGTMIGAYAVVQLTNGANVVEYMTREEILKVKATSQSARKGYGPWADWEEEMWRKTVLKRAAKYVPQDEDLSRALERDDEDHDLTLLAKDKAAGLTRGAAAVEMERPGVAGLKAAMAARRQVDAEPLEEAEVLEASDDAADATQDATQDDEAGDLWGDA